MLGYVEIVLFIFIFIYIFKFNILSQGKERPAKTKLMPAKLSTVLGCGKSDSVKC